MMVEGKECKVEKGCTVFVTGDAEHGVRNEGLEELRWFYVFAADSFGDVVYRFSAEEGQNELGVSETESEELKNIGDGR